MFRFVSVFGWVVFFSLLWLLVGLFALLERNQAELNLGPFDSLVVLTDVRRLTATPPSLFRCRRSWLRSMELGSQSTVSSQMNEA